MTVQQKTVVKQAVLIAGTLALLGLAWDSKLDKQEFTVHEGQVNAQYESIMEVICSDHPTHRRCK